MKKIKTKTQNGTGVVFSIQHEEIRCEINHPKMGKMITYGQKYGEKNGISGLFTYSLSAGNAFLTVLGKISGFKMPDFSLDTKTDDIDIASFYEQYLQTEKEKVTDEKKEIQPLLNELKNNKDRKDVK